MSRDYNSTLNLPKTDFPMRANLPKREPLLLEHWDKLDLYAAIMEKNAHKPPFILHDGPPFSNGHIHMGHALNKGIKDFIVRLKNMSGFRAPFTPGWDNHGMPIESAIIKQNKLDRKNMSVPQFRRACQNFAENYINIQRDEFKRLAYLADWDKPYLTMNPSFEAAETRIFGDMFNKGFIYKGLKPVYWCTHDETSLAEAEIEYAAAPASSIYVRFKLTSPLPDFTSHDDTFVLIWTTTPWTLPANLAISINPDFEYVLYQLPSGTRYIIARQRLDDVVRDCDFDGGSIIASFKGRSLELLESRHPFFDRISPILLGNHVTLDAGTGCVHTAPGHGMDDFIVCKAYDDRALTNLGVLVPVDSRGIMTQDAGPFAGMFYDKANPAIIEYLQNNGALVAASSFSHQYPHCWRCKKPIIFRATDQWFCSVDAFKDSAVSACDTISWLPDWGRDRMTNMIKERSDWCISRQRHWGLPIPVFYCSSCSKPICSHETIDKVADLYQQSGSNVWYEYDASALLPDNFTCPHCGASSFTKESDTLDCWFDSGSSHIAALELNDPSHWPADLYLEGGDQFRGWFQSSLLTSVALRDSAPYRSVLTNGWTLDANGKPMHKSLGNVISPEDIIKRYGADIIRLWIASVDYRSDVRVGDALFKQLSDSYLKIRNTARFILGNLHGFDPHSDIVAPGLLPPLDRWALSRLNALIKKSRAAFDKYEFHVVYHAIHNFCVIDLSSFYLDVVKDRLYCEETNGFLRKSAQTVIFSVLDAMVRLLAPILAFTTEEIWQNMPHYPGSDTRSVFLNDLPLPNPDFDLPDTVLASWERILKLRNDVNKALEDARVVKLIGKPLDADISLYVNDQRLIDELSQFDLRALFIVSNVNLIHGSGSGYSGDFDGITIAVSPSLKDKCPRCWTHSDLDGELCPRCAQVVIP